MGMTQSHRNAHGQYVWDERAWERDEMDAQRFLIAVGEHSLIRSAMLG